MTTRLLVISDLHISPPGPLASFHQGAALAAFVRAHAAPDTTLIIAGDGLDFLQVDPRPHTLDMPRAPDLIERTLAGIAEAPWGADLFGALAHLLESGGRLVILPGNHDPELYDPAAGRLLLRALHLPGDHAGLLVHTDDAPYRARIGRWDAVVGHGHRSDAFNDIDPAAVRRAIASGDSGLALPPGSRVVLNVINRFKRARDAKTGDPRFAFIDLLKPELPAVALLLLYLDLPLALAGLKDALGPIAHKVLRGARRQLQGGPTLGPAEDGDAEADPLEVLGEAMAAGFDDAERRSPTRCVRSIEDMLSGAEAAAAGTLATHGEHRFLFRAFLRRASRDGTFFEPTIAGADDRRVIDEHLAGTEGPRVVIAGHTHAARDIRDGERVYLNTGTWSDLMLMPRLDDRAAVETFTEDLSAGRVPRVRRPTYAEVTEAGPRLLEWTDAGGVPVKALPAM